MKNEENPIYEFITPSDSIVFRAENEKIAWLVSCIVGGGKAWYGKCDGEKGQYDSLLMFSPEGTFGIMSLKILGCDAEKFIKDNNAHVVAALRSFMYGNAGDMKQFEIALSCITDVAKRKEFLEAHDDIHRTSISTWVKYAWSLADGIEKELQGKNDTEKSDAKEDKPKCYKPCEVCGGTEWNADGLCPQCELPMEVTEWAE